MHIATQSLRNNRVNVNGAELVYICKQLSEKYPEINVYYELLKKLPQNIFHIIWSTPESYLWSKITWDLIHQETTESKFLNNYLNWNSSSSDEQLKIQINKLLLFILSGHILLDKKIIFSDYINVSKTGSFPGAGISWSFNQAFEILGYHNKKIIVQINNKEYLFDISEVFDPNANSLFFYQPKVDDCEMSIDIWSECARMDFEGMEWIHRLNDHDKINKFKLTIHEALINIKKYDETIYKELNLLISKIVPLEVISDAVPSSSNSTILGIVFCTYCEDPLLLAEMFIHELSHNKLFLFQETDPLLNSEIHGDGWSDESFYSPWRSDQRPLNGILHGLYVFVEVIGFWNSVVNDFNTKDYEHISFKRFYLLVEQVKIAFDVLNKNATFTEHGNELMNSMNQKINQFSSNICQNDLESTSAHFAELDFDTELIGHNIIDAIQIHKTKWMNS